MWQTKYALTVPKNLGVGAEKAISSPGVRSLCSILLEEYVTHHYGNKGCQVFKGGIFLCDPSLQ